MNMQSRGERQLAGPWPVRPLSSRLSAGGRTLTRRGLGSGAARVGHLYNDSLHWGFLRRRPPAEKMPFPCPELHACEHLPSLGEACSSREATGICTEHAADELSNSREERGFSAVVCWGQQDSCLSVRGLDGSALI
nr:uncharacterized protein LOC112422955 isoform X1 [Macaca nemestrina]